MCTICGKTFSQRDIFLGAVIRDVVVKEIIQDHPDWSPEDFICRADLAKYRAKYVRSLLESEKGELTNLNVLLKLFSWFGKLSVLIMFQHKSLT
ncbi:MAG: hypothetical protein A2161_19250 [Candidatus Schekmanbacteria bacterium RBG_13_48_7]|uniref:Uncharacterized protein n=1 Tax=Candidatus Schekmanbacteria bacterium RBG_13_48_7 TaxID=1817878 RepID=A0A1F7SB48_9BACT|nr:MAG: hypothetical protein A2161_19250 [Candidatus Schekmanbacteria bacterium RBG_13_48_7]